MTSGFLDAKASRLTAYAELNSFTYAPLHCHSFAWVLTRKWESSMCSFRHALRTSPEYRCLAADISAHCQHIARTPSTSFISVTSFADRPHSFLFSPNLIQEQNTKKTDVRTHTHARAATKIPSHRTFVCGLCVCIFYEGNDWIKGRRPLPSFSRISQVPRQWDVATLPRFGVCSVL